MPAGSPGLRLFCIPFAGGGPSAFRGWAQSLGPSIEAFYAHFPGREGRFREQPLSSVAALAELVVEAMVPWLDRPFALMGHSLGGLIAFEAAHLLRNRSLPLPRMLFVSAARAPQLPPRHSPLHLLSDIELLKAVNVRYAGSVPAPVLNSPELVSLLTPALRADLTALETYTYVPRPPLDCPMSVFGGRQDGAVTTDDLAPWAVHCTEGFQLRMVDAGHLFLQSALTDVVDAIRDDLAGHVGSRPAVHEYCDGSVTRSAS